MKDIVFLDIETDKDRSKIYKIGIIYKEKKLKTSSLDEVKKFLLEVDTSIICGHNIIDFDYEILKETSLFNTIKKFELIDTLLLSLLLLNEKTLHKLLKPYKIEDEFQNDPLEDAINTSKLLNEILDRFNNHDEINRQIYKSLLYDSKYFKTFFKYSEDKFLEYDELQEVICQKYLLIDKDSLKYFYLNNKKEELAFILSVLSDYEPLAYPPAVLYRYVDIVEIQKKLLHKVSDKYIKRFSKEVFGYDSFREFKRVDAGLFSEKTLSQEEIVKAALNDESLLAVLPTGGGKTFTFWLPALINAARYKSLTVVISPLQALMEDHIKSFNASVANFKAVAISGFLNPLERAEAIESVINGEADILYIAPESLRSNTIFKILKNRYIDIFVIDEAHCLSIWGNDFRQDYFYICEYIQDLLDNKPFQNHIPISCFTATAKPSVIDDIHRYFKDGLGIDLNDYIAVPQRENLEYFVVSVKKEEKYSYLLKLINSINGSTLIYIPTSTKECDNVASKLALDTAKNVASFHSKLDTEKKMEILKDYIDDKIEIIVATTAFGMGVDKPNIKNVIHYEISDSLENYAQEAGRGARDTSLVAKCILMFDENDLDEHFLSLNRSKLSVSEINSIFKVLKKDKSKNVYKTAYEIALQAGWDVEDSSFDYAAKVKTALLELEREGYIQRKRNKVQFFADSIDPKAIEKIHHKLQHTSYTKEEKNRLVLIVQTFLGRGKLKSIEIDEVSHILGFEKAYVAEAILQLKNLELIGENKDLSLRCSYNSLKKIEYIKNIEDFLYKYLKGFTTKSFAIRELNQELLDEGLVKKNEVELIKKIVKSWKSSRFIYFVRINRERDIWKFELYDNEKLSEFLKQKHTIITKITEFFKNKLTSKNIETIEFSLVELQNYISKNYSYKKIDSNLLFLHEVGIFELLYGRFITYMPMQIKLNEKIFQRRKYLVSDYQKRLLNHYLTKTESIHIIGEYAKRLTQNKENAKTFMKDYFTLKYEKFKKKYKLLKETIQKPMTIYRYKKIFQTLSDEQKNIINDKNSKAIMILAGPGSGKTKTLVHKIASLILNEDVKPQNFTMLTFSNSAKWEFKSRLIELIGSMAFDVEIQTFHSYALNLIGQSVKKHLDTLDEVIKKAINSLKNDEITLPFISVLMLDEYQDINQDSFELLKTIYQKYEKDLRIIAVGDDDQCIMQHSGANVEYINDFRELFKDESFKWYELLTNYRSDKNIVKYSNEFINSLEVRYKTKPLQSISKVNGKVVVLTYSRCESLTSCVCNLIKKEEHKLKTLILAHSNEEVLEIYSNLKANHINSHYLLSREAFKLKNILELYEFDKLLQEKISNNILTKNDFNECLETISNRYKDSKSLDILYKVVERFLAQTQEYYISQWIGYIEEISLEDFEQNEKIIVSTIHKSKGMEFDRVYLLVNMTNKIDDNMKRLYYVGMTRAKHQLYILRKGKKHNKKSDYVEYVFDDKIYKNENKRYTFVMSLSDINLGFDNSLYKNITIFSGLNVTIEKKDKFYSLCIIYNNQVIGIFSKSFDEKIKKYLNKGFKIESCIIEYVVMWEKPDTKKVLKHPLCKIDINKRVNKT